MDIYKSLPTMFSKTELFPLDCDPTTAIWGRSMVFWACDKCGQRVGSDTGIETHSDSCKDIL